MTDRQNDQPLWDVALEALLMETFQEDGQPLHMERLRNLASQHAIRLDDILDTLCRLCEEGNWTFADASGQPSVPDPSLCRLLHANHRLNDVQLGRLSGSWRPNDQA